MASYSKYLCKACYNIPISLFCEPIDEKQLFLHHDSVKSLQASAESGDCKLCSLLYSAVDPTRKPGQHRYGQPGDSLGQNMGHGTFLRVAISREDYSRGRPRLIMSIGELGPEFVFDIEYSDNPLSSCFYPESQLDQSAFSLASSWIHKCVSSHDTCQRLYDVSFKPTRLIDVGQSGLHPRLINTKDHNPEDLQYVALSHCWGPPGSMPEAAKTSDVSLPTRLKKIPIQTLPRTFRDAIIVTRKLGCRYLWIDSLCIIQNSATDWQRESSEMGKVYSHSFCTIAPAASSDCHGGFFPELRKLPILSARRHSVTSIRPSEPLAVLIKRPQDWDGLFVQSPLNSRGWTLQERELSPRVLYFTKHTLLYECKEARASENEPFALKSTLDRKIEDDRVGRSLRCLDTVVTDEYATRHFEHSMSWHYDKWMLLVEDYITKELTNPSDRFPALSGLASEFSYLLNDNYVAGLWEKDLLRGLCWQYSNRRDTKDQKIMKQTINYGPTWSWAKMVLPITYDLVRRKSSHIQQHPASSKNTSRNWKEPQIQRIGITPEGADPNGTLLSAQIQLLGQLKHLKRSKSGDYDIDGRPLVISWDSLPQSPSQIYILSLGSLEIGLVLVASERVDGEYLRIGLLQEIDWRWFRDLEVRVLTLV